MGNFNSNFLKSCFKREDPYSENVPFFIINENFDPEISSNSPLSDNIRKSNEERLSEINAQLKRRLHKESELKKIAQAKLCDLQEAVEKERKENRQRMEIFLKASIKSTEQCLEQDQTNSECVNDPHGDKIDYTLVSDNICETTILAKINEMRQFLESLVSENMELSERKYALNVVKDDLIKVVDRLAEQRDCLKKKNDEYEKIIKKLEHRVGVLEYVLSRTGAGGIGDVTATKTETVED